jgi:uncharacterized delta-60 repeat protein
MRPLLRLLFGFAVLTASLAAQEQWSAATTPSAQNLWSVAWGTGTFVAVGENGTVLTSPDGATWTSRASGTSAWLVGVAFAAGQFVIVGERGTLLTSDDGVAWIARASGTTERLNGVAFGNERWLAVGEKGAALVSRDGRTWSVVASGPASWSYSPVGWLHGVCAAAGVFVATGDHGRIVTSADGNFFEDHSVETRANLESVVFARHQFVAVGDNGLVLTSRDGATWRGRLAPQPLRAIAFFNQHFVGAAGDGSIATSPDAQTWTTRATGNSRLLTAVAANESMCVAVGFGGTVLRSSAVESAPVIVTAPASNTEAAGNHVLLSVVATGSAPLTYEWQHEGRTIAGATRDTLALRAVSAVDIGRYRVIVRNPLGGVASNPATVAVAPAFAAPGDPVDPSFTPWRPPLGSPAPTALLPLPDGKILAAFGVYVARLLPDGALDPTFGARAQPTENITALALLPDGRVLAGGKLGDGALLARLAADGTTDATFRPPSLAGAITSIAVQPDGKILLANNTARLVRLESSGALDAGFSVADLSQFPNRNGVFPNIRLVAVAPDSRIVVATTPATVQFGFPAAADVLIACFRRDGTLDPAFAPVYTGETVPQLLSVEGDGRILLASEYHFFSFESGRWKIQRLNTDGSTDATFLTLTGNIPKYGGTMRAAIDAEDRITIVATARNSTPGFRVQRLSAEGEIDTTLRYADPAYGLFQNDLNAIACQPDGRVLVSSQRGFTRLLATNAPRLNPPLPLDDAPPTPQTVAGGGTAKFYAPDFAGTGPFTYFWSARDASGSVPLPYALDLNAVTIEHIRSDLTAQLTVSNPAGSLAAPPQRVRVPATAPAIVGLPAEISAGAGRFVALTFDALGSGPLTYQWIFEGRLLESGVCVPRTDSDQSLPEALQLTRFNAAQAGVYQLVLSNALGSATASVRVKLDAASRLVALATRGFVGANESAIVAGFVVRDGPKWVLIRGVGPTLAGFGVRDALATPQLTLFDARGVPLEENAGWRGTAESYSTLNWPATFPLPEGSRDAIISQRLPAGAYTVKLAGTDGATGTALLEVYENINDQVRLANLSSRVVVGAGERVAIGGIVIGGGTAPRRLLVRAVGPGLAGFGVASPLKAPVLTLVDSRGAAVARNDGWDKDGNAAALAAAAVQVGAFPLAASSAEAALLVTLPPGNYSAIVSGSGDASGVALLEIYDVP